MAISIQPVPAGQTYTEFVKRFLDILRRSILEVDASTTSTEIYTYSAKTGDYTVLTTDRTIDCTGTITITLPTAVGNDGQCFVVKNSGSGSVTVDADGTETIDGALSHVIANPVALKVQSNGANWIII